MCVLDSGGDGGGGSGPDRRAASTGLISRLCLDVAPSPEFCVNSKQTALARRTAARSRHGRCSNAAILMGRCYLCSPSLQQTVVGGERRSEVRAWGGVCVCGGGLLLFCSAPTVCGTGMFQSSSVPPLPPSHRLHPRATHNQMTHTHQNEDTFQITHFARLLFPFPVFKGRTRDVMHVLFPVPHRLVVICRKEFFFFFFLSPPFRLL